jgi:hypothetical protein
MGLTPTGAQAFNTNLKDAQFEVEPRRPVAERYAVRGTEGRGRPTVDCR